MAKKYLGYQPQDHTTEYAKYYNETIRPVPDDVQSALENSPFPAGHCKGVCIGGYLLQGGYGWNGRKTGIACESVIGIDVVTADGTYIHANEHQNADIFWSARGSGGGFFGVVVRFHLKLFTLPKYRAIIVHDFYIKHLEYVYNWAYEVGPSIPKAVEFQMLMSNKWVIFGEKFNENLAKINHSQHTKLILYNV